MGDARPGLVPGAACSSSTAGTRFATWPCRRASGTAGSASRLAGSARLAPSLPRPVPFDRCASSASSGRDPSSSRPPRSSPDPADAPRRDLRRHRAALRRGDGRCLLHRAWAAAAGSFAWGSAAGSHAEQTGAMLAALEPIIAEAAPDAVLVYGDTNSTLAGALAAAKLHVPGRPRRGGAALLRPADARGDQSGRRRPSLALAVRADAGGRRQPRERRA